MGLIQGNINKLLALGAAYKIGGNIANKNETTEAINKEKLTNLKLRNKNLRMKNRALRNMQDNGISKANSKQGFNDFVGALKQQGVSEDYINKNTELLKTKYKEDK